MKSKTVEWHYLTPEGKKSQKNTSYKTEKNLIRAIIDFGENKRCG